MRRLIPQALVALVLGILITGSASATTYYIAASGSDGNNGTSNSSPWQHAPGMPNCSGSCASTTPKAGDRFVFRGGDTWHFSNSSRSPYVGNGTWSWNSSWGGSSSNCNFDASLGPVARASCVYIGVDTSWYTGSSWVRPVLTMDNPLSTSFVSSCAYLDDSVNAIFLRAPYVIFDNFDIQGNCSGSSPNAAIVTVFATPIEFSNSYWHGWTVTASGNAGGYSEIGCSGCKEFVLFDHNVMDGSDSSGASTPHTGTQKGMNLCADVEYNVVRYVSNFCVDAGTTKNVHDNLFEYLYNPAGGHGNVIELLQGSSSSNFYFYNNVYRHSDEGVGFDLITANGGNLYAFNNIFYDNANASNCFGPGAPDGASSVSHVYFYNNTVDSQANVQGNTNGGCQMGLAGGNKIAITFQNNHLINYASSTVSSLVSCGGCSITDNGSEVWQSESVANGQGYTASNSYQPTSSSGATYHSGANKSSSCSTFSGDSSFCSGTTGGMTTVAGAIPTPYIFPTPERGTTWDAGAYQFGSAVGVSPPTGLAAVVQ